MSHLVKNFKFAWHGLVYIFKREKNFKIELILFVLAVLVAWWLEFSIMAWALLILLAVLVIILEINNTIIERILDMVEPRLSGQVGLIKDIQAAIVLMMAAAAFLVGLLLIIEHLP
ncbi:MAG: diacylglycerol kinase [Patescibacteria group bacterium]